LVGVSEGALEGELVGELEGDSDESRGLVSDWVGDSEGASEGVFAGDSKFVQKLSVSKNLKFPFPEKRFSPLRVTAYDPQPR
jgi:hypothetical protein